VKEYTPELKGLPEANDVISHWPSGNPSPVCKKKPVKPAIWVAVAATVKVRKFDTLRSALFGYL